MGQKRRLLAVSSPVFKKAGTFVSKLGAEPHAPAAGRKTKAPRPGRGQKNKSPMPRPRAEKYAFQPKLKGIKKRKLTAIWHIFTDLSPFYFNNSFRSSSGVVIGAIPKFSTR